MTSRHFSRVVSVMEPAASFRRIDEAVEPAHSKRGGFDRSDDLRRVAQIATDGNAVSVLGYRHKGGLIVVEQG